MQNSLFVPDLGRYLNRRPTYNLTRHASQGTFAGTTHEKPVVEEASAEVVDDLVPPTRVDTAMSMTSELDEDHFAVLPHGERLQGWTTADREELDDHVRHLLHSKKEKFKRGMKGFGQYVRKRKWKWSLGLTLLTSPSSWTLCYCLRILYYSLRPRMGLVSYR